MTRRLLLLVLLAAGAALAAPPKPPLRVGAHKCRVSSEYKLRGCTVERRGDATWLVVTGKHLVELEARLEADATNPNLVHAVDGRLLGERPFLCHRCQPQCSEPADAERGGAPKVECACQEVPAAARADCMKQRVAFVLQRQKGRWAGDLPVDLYDGGEPPRRSAQSYRIEVTP